LLRPGNFHFPWLDFALYKARPFGPFLPTFMGLAELEKGRKWEECTIGRRDGQPPTTLSSAGFFSSSCACSCVSRSAGGHFMRARSSKIGRDRGERLASIWIGLAAHLLQEGAPIFARGLCNLRVLAEILPKFCQNFAEIPDADCLAKTKPKRTARFLSPEGLAGDSARLASHEQVAPLEMEISPARVRDFFPF